MKAYQIETLSQKQIEALGRKELRSNEYICETAGFEPLEVRLKRLEMAGQLRNAQRTEFTSSDYREMFLNPDYSLSLDDEPEDVIEKMHAIQAHIQDVRETAIKRNKENLKADEAQASKAGQGEAAAAVAKDDVKE